MRGKFLFETNIVIGLFQSEEAIIERLKQIKNIFIPGIVIRKLYFALRCPCVHCFLYV
jgi:predicted nucleic acid-binding protein